jgi:iron complex transport system substrate-binding protein
MVLFLLASLVLLLSGCGGSSDDDRPAGSGGTAQAADGTTFPQTVEHKFGSTTVTKKPERIAVVGLTEQDTVLQLGYKPIATTEWYGDQPSATWPWAQKLLGDSKPTVLSNADGFEVEKLAELRPDLIIGVNSGMDDKAYAQLSKLAPTIPAGKGATDYFSPWDEQVELIARALGKPEEGKRLIEKVKADYAAAAAANPEFEGKTATFSQNGFYSGLLYVYQQGLNTEFLEYLGFTINPKLTPLVKNPGEQVAVSEERLDVIDADVIVFATESAKDIANFKKVPTFRFLNAVKGNHAVYTDATLSGAMYFMTPLALEYVLERLTPQLAKAVAGEAPQEMVG